MRLALVLLAACSGAGSTDFAIDGNVSGAGAPMTGDVLVMWQFSSGQPAYQFGTGSATKTSFMVDLPGELAAQAINPDGVGVGVFVLGAEATPTGTSSDYAVIWKSGTAQPAEAWADSFGASYSCAQCVRGGAGSTDSYQLTACANVTIVVPAGTPCAWF